MTKLLDLETKLSILALNPCACAVCRQATERAKQGLSEVSPGGALLLKLPQGTPEFAVVERQFREDETVRLQAVYDLIGQVKCLMAGITPPAPPPTLTPIPDLPAAEEWREQIERYRKHAMKPRLRRDSVEEIKNPRVPGSYYFK